MIVKSRLLRWLIRIVAAFLLFSALVLSLAIFTPLPDRIAWSTLEKAVQSAGGSVTARREGTLITGMDLCDLSVRVPGKVALRIRRIHVRLSPWALVVGVARLKDVKVEAPDLTLIQGPSPPAVKPYRNPRWLRLWIPKFQVLEGRIAVLPPPSESSDPSTWSDLAATGNLLVEGQDLRLTLAGLTVRCPPPAPSDLAIRGSASFVLGRGGQIGLYFKTGRSKLAAKGRIRMHKEELRNFDGEVTLKGLSLREVFASSEGVPDLVLEGSLALEGDTSGLRWKGDLAAISYGSARSEGNIRWAEGGLSIASTASTPGFDLTPIWNPLPKKRILCRGEGRWSLEILQGKPARWDAWAKAHDAVFMDVQVSEADLESHGEGTRATISGPFVTSISGPGTLAVAWDTGPETWSVRVTGSSASVPEALSNWDIRILSPPPGPLHPPVGKWEIQQVLLRGAESKISIEAQGKDPCGAEVSFRSAQFGEGTPVSWDVIAHKVDPASWALGPHGEVDGHVRFEGPDWNRGTLDFDMGSGSWGNVRYQPFKARLRFSPDILKLDPCALSTSAGNGRVSGTLKPGEHLDADVDATVPDLALLKPFLNLDPLKGSLEGSAHISGPPSVLSLRGRASTKNARAERFAAASASAAGSIGLSGKSADLKLAWRALAIGETELGDGSASLLGPFADTRIHLDASAGEGRKLALDARGNLGRHSGNLRIAKGRVDAEGRTFEQDGEATLSWDPAAVSCSGLALHKKDASLIFSMRMGLGTPDPPVSGSLEARHIPLKLFPIPPTAGTPSGLIEADLTWSGTLEHPSLAGDGSLEEGSYRYPRSDLVITPIVLKMQAKGDRLVLIEATATTAEGGKATGSGSVRFRGFLPETFDLKATGRDFPFLLGRDVQGRCDFESALTGSPGRPLLSGTARVLKGKIQLPEVVKQQPLPSSIRFVHGPVEAAPQAPDEPAGPQRLGGAVRLETNGGLWISNRSLLAELAGALDVTFTPDGPAVAGGLEVVEGRYLFRGRKFDLRDSRIFFGGTTNLTPSVDIRAQYIAGGIEITVHLTGDPSRPNLGLSSSPPLPREDILSLLLFGTTSSELSNLQRQTSDRSAAALAQQFGTIPVSGARGGPLGLDAVEVGTSAVGFSKYVGDKLVVEYRQIFGALPEQRLNLRYRINRKWSFETQISDAGKSGADILWEKRY